MAFAVLNYQLESHGVYDSFWKFVLSHETGVIGTAAGVTLGISTAALAYVMVSGLVVPLLAALTTLPLAFINKKLGRRATAAMYGEARPQFDLARVWHVLLLWILVVIIVFVVLEGLRRIARAYTLDT